LYRAADLFAPKSGGRLDIPDKPTNEMIIPCKAYETPVGDLGRSQGCDESGGAKNLMMRPRT
jgi:hypothetical protein